MTSKADLFLSVFTKDNYENLNYKNNTFRNSMYDGIEVDRSYLKHCDFSEGTFKDVSTTSNLKVISYNLDKSIFENVNFFRTLISKSNSTVTLFDENHFNILTIEHSILENNNIRNVKFDDVTFKKVIFEDVIMDLYHFENVKIKDCVFKYVTINNSSVPEKSSKELHKQDVTFENM